METQGYKGKGQRHPLTITYNHSQLLGCFNTRKQRYHERLTE